MYDLKKVPLKYDGHLMNYLFFYFSTYILILSVFLILHVNYLLFINLIYNFIVIFFIFLIFV